MSKSKHQNGVLQPAILFHLANVEDAQKMTDSGFYRAPSLVSEGFVHCCLPAQLAGVIERYYSTVDAAVLLVLNAEQLDPAPVYENTVGGTELFPHIYGQISGKAVQASFSLDNAALLKIVSDGEFSGYAAN